MTTARRRMFLFTLLALTASLVIWDRRKEPSAGLSVSEPVVRPYVRVEEASSRHAGGQVISMPRSREAYLQQGGTIFDSPPVTPAVAVASAVPNPPLPASAPPIPFAIIGRKLDEGAWEVYLGMGEKVLIAKPGLTLAENYLVNRIDAIQIEFVYLPLMERQVLTFGTSLND